MCYVHAGADVEKQGNVWRNESALRAREVLMDVVTWLCNLTSVNARTAWVSLCRDIREIVFSLQAISVQRK